jgi:arylsulfatase A-like enzyme
MHASGLERPTHRRRVVVAALVAWLVGCGGARPPNLLLVVIDTCRVDRMSLYGYAKPTTPNLERLAAEGVVFDQAVTHVPQTLPSVATILTSTLPSEHGVRVNGLFRLPDSAVTLAEVLREAGYDTVAFLSGFPLDSRFGIAQGFGSYDARFVDSILTRTRRRGVHFPGHRHPDFEQRADETTDKVLAWLEARGGRGAHPFFLLVHYFDPHYPYNAPPQYLADLEPYDAEIAFTDASIGRLVAKLRGAGLLDGTLVVVVGDHGEMLEPKPHHAGRVTDAVLRVPLLLHGAASLPRAARIPAQVALVDVAPTILDLLGVPAPPAFRGRSLLPLVRGEQDGARASVPFETLYWQLEQEHGLARHGVRTPAWKYVLEVRQKDGRVARSEMLFDLARDPAEGTNLAGDAETRATHRRLLESFRRQVAEQVAQGVTGERLPLTPEVEDRLRSLGYLGS